MAWCRFFGTPGLGLARARRQTSVRPDHYRGLSRGGLKMKTTYGPARRTKSNGRTIGSIPFASTCPSCAQVRPQRGYDKNSLVRLLNRGYPVEAYCAVCDEFWSIGLKERAVLVA